jgi:tetratricopeptide (TPR) repeat protein
MDDAAWESEIARLESAEAAIEAGRVGTAGRLARTAARRLRRGLGSEHPDVAAALDTLGLVASARGRRRQALAYYRAALAIHDRHRSDPAARALRISPLWHLGHELTVAGRFAAAEAALREAIAESERAFARSDLRLAHGYNLLGVCLKLAGRYREAERAYRRVGALFAAAEQVPPAAYFHNLAGLACAQNDFGAAESHARRAVELRRHEGDSRGLGADLCGLADALAGQGRAAEAEASYRDALACYRRAGASARLEIAYALHSLGDTLSELGRAAEAEQAYRASIRRKARALGARHHEVAASLSNLAALLFENGRRADAIDAAARARAIVRRVLGARHPVRVGCEALAHALSAPG